MRLGNAAHWFQKNVALLLASCILSAAIAPGLVFAQETNTEQRQIVNTTNGTFGEGGVPSETGEIGTGGTAEAGGAVQGTTDATAPDQQGGFGYIDLDCPVVSFGEMSFDLSCLVAHIANILLELTASLVGFMGWLLDYAMLETVVQMGENVSQMSGVTTAWQVVRDVSNLIFIFGLLVIGIATILRVTNYGYKTLLRNLIIAAILINFSLLFAKMVIDVSNLMATELFKRVNSNPACAEGNFQLDSAAYQECIDRGITGIFAERLRITTVYDPQTAAEIQKNKEQARQVIIPMGIFGSIFFIITAFVFAAGAVLLIIRFAVLIILMIFSPIAFAGMVLPQTQKYTSDWWHRLFAQSFFAPAYLFMIWISMVVLNSATLAGLGGGNFVDAIAGKNVDAASIFITFGIAIAFMIASLVVASKLGAYGAGAAVKFGSNASKNIGGIVAASTAGYAMSKGRRGYNYLHGQAARLDDSIEGNKVARRTRKTLNLVAGAATLGTYTVGKAAAKGALRQGIPNALKAGEEHKFFGTHSYKSMKDASEARDKEVTAEMTQIRAGAAARKAQRSGILTDEEKKLLQNLDAKALEKLGAALLANKNVAENLTKAQIDAIDKIDNFTQAQKLAIKEARFANLKERAASSDAAEKKKAVDFISSLKPSQIGEVPADVLKHQHIAEVLDNNQLDQLRRGGNLKKEDRQAIYKAIESAMTAAGKNIDTHSYFENPANRRLWQ